MKRLLLLAGIPLAILNCAVAHADVGNFGPGGSSTPGLCSYPAVCDAGSAGGVIGAYWYTEDWPVELNGSHRHCYYHGVMTQGNVGFSMILELGGTGPVGALIGGCHFVCPDGQLASWPNPVGGYKDAIIPTRCKPVGPNPDMPVDISPPIAEQGAVPAIPFGQPQPPPGEPPPPPPPPPAEELPQPGPADVAPSASPPLAEQLPSQTNPTCPNPAATTSAGC